jgi:aspartate kinase
LADAAAMRRAEQIVRANPERRYIVPSAPGKRHADDRKITDLLYAWHSMATQGFDASEPAEIIRDRYTELAREVGVKLYVKELIAEIAAKVSDHATPDYMASRGEYLNGRLMAELLGATFVDPADCIKFDELGNLDPITYELLGDRLKGPGLFVVPGFYGLTANGEIKTFSRGGSDITGAIVARAARCNLYENWTDVSGFFMADPRIVPHAKHIEEITYQELRELSYMGATVLHDEAIFPVRELGIPINIRNTRDPEHPGTMIVSDRKAHQVVCGIAGKAGFTMLNIEKAFMNKERGYGRRVLQVIEDFGMGWEHMPTGIDTISLILTDDELKGRDQALLEAIEKHCDPDEVSITTGLAMIATVGVGMNHHLGVAGRLCTALAEAGVNIRVIDQGSSEMNIIIGVEDHDLQRAVGTLYEVFKDWR